MNLVIWVAVDREGNEVEFVAEPPTNQQVIDACKGVLKGRDVTLYCVTLSEVDREHIDSIQIEEVAAV